MKRINNMIIFNMKINLINLFVKIFLIYFYFFLLLADWIIQLSFVYKIEILLMFSRGFGGGFGFPFG